MVELIKCDDASEGKSARQYAVTAFLDDRAIMQRIVAAHSMRAAGGMFVDMYAKELCDKCEVPEDNNTREDFISNVVIGVSPLVVCFESSASGYSN